MPEGSPVLQHGSRSRPSLSDASGREFAGCSVVAYDAKLRAAGRPSTFRTGLANMTGPHWFGRLGFVASVSSRPTKPSWRHSDWIMLLKF